MVRNGASMEAQPRTSDRVSVTPGTATRAAAAASASSAARSPDTSAGARPWPSRSVPILTRGYAWDSILVQATCRTSAAADEASSALTSRVALGACSQAIAQRGRGPLVEAERTGEQLADGVAQAVATRRLVDLGAVALLDELREGGAGEAGDLVLGDQPAELERGDGEQRPVGRAWGAGRRAGARRRDGAPR